MAAKRKVTAKNPVEKDEILAKEKLIQKEIARLKKQFKDIDESTKNLVNATIEDVAFMTITMQDLKKIIMREGTVSEYQNGENQYGTKQSPEAQLYLQFSQKMTAAMKLLKECLPKQDKTAKPQDDGFDDFVNAREDV